MEQIEFAHLRHGVSVCMMSTADAILDDFIKKGGLKRVCEKRTYTVNEVAALLGISRTSAYEFVKRGEVKFVKIGVSIRISKKSFDEWLDQQNI